MLSEHAIPDLIQWGPSQTKARILQTETIFNFIGLHQTCHSGLAQNQYKGQEKSVFQGENLYV